MSHQKAAKEYPNSIFSQTTPDETQELEGNLRFNTWHKGWLTRSRIYERKLPGEQEVSALRIDGPGDAFMSIRHDGSVRILTGVKDKNKGPQSGLLGIKTFGQQQLHQNRSDLQYCAGDDEDGQALNVICYGDYVENVKGSTRYVYATKIILSATAELILEGGSIKLQSDGDIEMAATAITTAQVNKKDIVTGQSKSQGSGENTTEQFDPRATTVINTPGSMQWNVAQDYAQRVGGRYQLTAAGAPGGLIKDSEFGIVMKTGTDFAVGGVKSSALYSSGPIDIDTTAELSITATDTEVTTANFTGDFATTSITTADLTVDAAAVGITGSGDVEITGANVRITGALIYLN